VVPPGDNLVSPADGVVVYALRVAPGEPVVSVKRGLAASVDDIVREEISEPKFLVGIFMSPFDVHHNRAPLAGIIEWTRHHPGSGRNHSMASMHWRSLLRREPRYANSPHVVRNNRAVTRIEGRLRGEPIACYVVQIGARTVAGIDVDIPPGERVEKGQRIGMIRIGSQVDVVVPALPSLRLRVCPGDRVRAGETILLD